MPNPIESLTNRKLLASVAVLTLPVALVFLILWLAGAIGLGSAFAGLVMAFLGLLLVCRGYLEEFLGVIRYADRLGGGQDEAPPEPRLSALAADLVSAVTRLGSGLRRERQQTAARVERLAAVVEALPVPLIQLDAGREVLQANAAARTLFGQALIGRDLAFTLRHPAALDAVRRVLAGEAKDIEVEISLPVPMARDFIGRAVRLPGAGAAAVLVLQDLTPLKRAEQLRADFVANASHELRTPLATLLGFIETLQGPAKDDAAARERFLAIMQDQAARMARLIGDLLSLSRIEMNEHTPPSGRVDLRQLIGSVVDMLRLQADAKGMRVEIAAPDDLPAVAGDADELTQVWQNLIDNAIKYGRPQTTVSIELKRNGTLQG